jgi:hypothetical protein
LSKKEVLRAIDESVLPTSLTPKVVNDMYGTLKSLDFGGWAGFLYCYRVF